MPVRPTKQRSQIVVSATIAVAVAGLATSVASIFPASPPRIAAANDLLAMRMELRDINDRVEAMAPVVASIRANPRQTSDVRSLTAEMTALNQRQKRLETIILRDPARALEMPLLQRDLQSARETTKAEIEGLKSGIDRLYTLIGGIGLMLVTLAATNYFTFGRKDKEESP